MSKSPGPLFPAAIAAAYPVLVIIHPVDIRLNPYSPASVARFLRANGIRPSRRLGQSFLTERGTNDRIVASSGLVPEEVCLEIGPGLGALTDILAEKCRGVVAVEVDHRLSDILSRRFAEAESVEIICADFLKLGLGDLLERIPAPVRVVANIPYSITTPVLEKLLEHKDRLTGIALLVQKEVAARVTAAPDSPDYSSLSIFCAYHAACKIAFHVNRHVFVPTPDVDSSLILLTPLKPDLLPPQESTFFRLLRAAFGQRRKTLQNALAVGMGIEKAEAAGLLKKADIGITLRAEELSVDDYKRLARTIADEGAFPSS